MEKGKLSIFYTSCFVLIGVLWGAVLYALSTGTIDTIYLKNGNKIETEKCWTEGKMVKFTTPAGTMAISIDEVAKIKKSEYMSQATSRGGVAQDNAAQISPKLEVNIGETNAPLSSEELRELEKAYRNNPIDKSLKADLVNARRLRINDLIKQGQFEKAIGELRSLLILQPRTLDVKLALGALYLRFDNISMAETQIREALLIDYSDADAHLLMGEVFYRQEKLTQAINEWKKSLQLRPNAALKARLEQLTREDAIRGDYRATSSGRFELRYTGSQNTELGKVILSALESMYSQLSRRLDYMPRGSIVVILYSDQDFYDATGAPRIVEGLYDGKVKMPIKGLRSITSEVTNVLMHELTHAFLHSKTKGNCPRWLHEGVAQYMEGKSARMYNYHLAQMIKSNGFSSLPLYPSSLSMIEYMIQAYGFSDILSILKALGNGMSVDMAMERYLHLSFEEFVQEWAEKALSVSP